jgi:hypothetical protein
MFARHPILATRNIDEVVARIRETGTKLALRRDTQMGAAEAIIRGRWLTRLSLSYVRYGFAARSAFAEEADTYNLSIPLAGSISVAQRRGAILAMPGMAALMSPGEPFGFDLSADLARLIVRFSASSVLRQYSLLFDATPRQPLRLLPVLAPVRSVRAACCARLPRRRAV